MNLIHFIVATKIMGNQATMAESAEMAVVDFKSPTGPWLLIDSTPMLVGCYELAENQPR